VVVRVVVGSTVGAGGGDDGGVVDAGTAVVLSGGGGGVSMHCKLNRPLPTTLCVPVDVHWCCVMQLPPSRTRLFLHMRHVDAPPVLYAHVWHVLPQLHARPAAVCLPTHRATTGSGVGAVVFATAAGANAMDVAAIATAVAAAGGAAVADTLGAAPALLVVVAVPVT